MDVRIRITSLEGFVAPRGLSPYVRDLPASAQFPRSRARARFLGDETTSSPLPFGENLFAVSATSLRRLTGKPLVGLSSLSFSRRGFFHPVPEPCHRPGSPCHRRRGSRRRTTVSRTLTGLSPELPGGLWPELPRGGLAARDGRHHHFECPARITRERAHAESFSVAPHPCAGRSGIECSRLLPEDGGLLAQASLEPDKPLSWHPALRARA